MKEHFNKIGSPQISGSLLRDVRDIGTENLTPTGLNQPVIYAITSLSPDSFQPIIAFAVYYHLAQFLAMSKTNALYVCGGFQPNSLLDEIWDEIYETSQGRGGINIKGSLPNIFADEGISRRRISDIVHTLPQTPIKFILGASPDGIGLEAGQFGSAIDGMRQHLKSFQSIIINCVGMADSSKALLFRKTQMTILIVNLGEEEKAASFIDKAAAENGAHKIGIIFSRTRFHEDIGESWAKLVELVELSFPSWPIKCLGEVPIDDSLAGSLGAARPLPLAFPFSRASRGARIVAAEIIEELTGNSPHVPNINLPPKPAVIIQKVQEAGPDEKIISIANMPIVPLPLEENSHAPAADLPETREAVTIVNESMTVIKPANLKIDFLETGSSMAADADEEEALTLSAIVTGSSHVERKRSDFARSSLWQDISFFIHLVRQLAIASIEILLGSSFKIKRREEERSGKPKRLLPTKEEIEADYRAGRMSDREMKVCHKIRTELDWCEEYGNDPRDFGIPTYQFRWPWPFSKQCMSWWLTLKLEKAIVRPLRECRRDLPAAAGSMVGLSGNPDKDIA